MLPRHPLGPSQRPSDPALARWPSRALFLLLFFLVLAISLWDPSAIDPALQSPTSAHCATPTGARAAVVALLLRDFGTFFFYEWLRPYYRQLCGGSMNPAAQLLLGGIPTNPVPPFLPLPPP